MKKSGERLIIRSIILSCYYFFCQATDYSFTAQISQCKSKECFLERKVAVVDDYILYFILKLQNATFTPSNKKNADILREPYSTSY